MSKKFVLSLAAVAAISATSAMAQTNPWAPAQTTVPITVTVQPMIELFTGTGAVGLSIVDAGENQGSATAVQRTLTHLHNVPATVSAEIDGNIPDNTQFHILIDPVAVWANPTASGASKTISWRREGGAYTGATGAFPNQVSSAGVGSPVVAFSAPSNAAGAGTSTKPIQYFADARNVMPATGSETFNVLWTITTP